VRCVFVVDVDVLRAFVVTILLNYVKSWLVIRTVAKKQVDLLACSNLLGSNQASKSSQSCAANQASQVDVPCLLDLLGLISRYFFGVAVF
jgi:hypothetical protein